MLDRDLEHSDISCALRTGYPHKCWDKPENPKNNILERIDLMEIKESKTIVSVCFKRKDSDEFSGRQYNYYSTIPVVPGDIVSVPTAQGTSIAQICEVDVLESKIDERILPLLKTITEYAPVEAQEELKICKEKN